MLTLERISVCLFVDLTVVKNIFARLASAVFDLSVDALYKTSKRNKMVNNLFQDLVQLSRKNK